MKATVSAVRIVRELDPDPDLSWLEQTDEQMGEGFQEYATSRLQAYGDGDWQCIGIYAEADVYTVGIMNTGRSGGLWGIASDDKDIEDVIEDELTTLAEILQSLGLSIDGITPEEVER